MSSEKNLILILGPTGVGKSKIAIKVAKHFDTEIVSADSRQIYKEMNIGTALPTNEMLKFIKHHLIQHISIHNDYNAYKYSQDALAIIYNIFQKKSVAFAVGGSMLYMDALCSGLDNIPDVDTKVRKNLVSKYENEGMISLQKMLKLLDKEYYQKVDLKNPKRLLHALEVCIMSGKPYSHFLKNKLQSRPFKMLKIGININRDLLYNALNHRVDSMIAQGLETEARKLYPYRNLQALNTIGYKEFFKYFEGKTTLNETIELIKRNTRRYAKRQLTWFKKDTDIKWFSNDDTCAIIDFLNNSIVKEN